MASANATTNSLRNAARAAWSSLMVLILFLSPQELGPHELAEPVAEGNEDDEIQRQSEAAYDKQTQIATLFGRRRLNAVLHGAVEAIDEQVIHNRRDNCPEDCPDQARKRQIDHDAAPSSRCQSPILQDPRHDDDHGQRRRQEHLPAEPHDLIIAIT